MLRRDESSRSFFEHYFFCAYYEKFIDKAIASIYNRIKYLNKKKNERGLI